MPIVSLPQLKDYLRDEKASIDDDVLTDALNSAHQTIYNACQRSFDVASTASARSYIPRGGVVRIHDCTTVTNVSNNGVTMSSAVYQLEPVGIDWSGESTPYQQIRLYAGWWSQTYIGQASVTVTATWGWLATPPGAMAAVKALAKDIALNRNVQFGLVAATEYAGIQAKQNAVVKQFINDYRRVESLGLG